LCESVWISGRAAGLSPDVGLFWFETIWFSLLRLVAEEMYPLVTQYIVSHLRPAAHQSVRAQRSSHDEG
jgi:hypothetical protein